MKSNQQRILDHSIPEPNSGCWLWTGGISNAGYGLCGSVEKRTVSAHRLAYAAFKCEIPPNRVIAHSCDNRLCVNPDHLWAATHKENSQDMVAKNRSAKGEQCARSKLTDEQVSFIRGSDLSNRALGRMLNVSHAAIGYVRRGATWN